jgi:hypothetical protein
MLRFTSDRVYFIRFALSHFARYKSDKFQIFIRRGFIALPEEKIFSVLSTPKKRFPSTGMRILLSLDFYITGVAAAATASPERQLIKQWDVAIDRLSLEDARGATAAVEKILAGISDDDVVGVLIDGQLSRAARIQVENAIRSRWIRDSKIQMV